MSKEEIEYEEVTIRVPKRVMDYLRRIYGDAVEHLEYHVVDHVRADLDAMSGRELVGLFGLETVFQTVLGDREAEAE